MTTIRARLVSAIATQQDHSANWIPKPLRILVRRFSGGDGPAFVLLRNFGWRYRYFIGLSLLANLAAAFFEAFTMLTINASLTFAASNTLSTNQYLAPILQPLQGRFEGSSIFLALIIIAVLAQIGRAWSDYASQSVAAHSRAEIEGSLRQQLFKQFTSLTYAEITKHKVGDLSSFIGEATRIGQLVTTSNNFLNSLVVIIFYVIVLFIVSWQMTLIVTVSLLFLSISLQRIRRGILKGSRQFLDSYVTMNSQVVEFLGGMRLLHTFGRQEYAREKVDSQINFGVRSMRRHLRLTALVPAVVQTAAVIGIAIFLTGGYWWMQQSNNGQEMIASLVAFVVIFYRMLPRFTHLNSSLARINEEYPVVQRVANHLRSDDKIYLDFGHTPFTALMQSIKFDDVTMSYIDTQQPALQKLNLTLKRGQMAAFVGASGSGKSTIISLLLRLYNVTEGAILVDDVPLSELCRNDWLNCIGIVDQDTFVLHDTVAENIRFGHLSATDDEVKAAASIANAHDFIMALANGYETIIGDRGHKLSGGQRQRLAIARAVLRNPDILILDEATSALDSKAERMIQESVDRLRTERTLIVIAHRLSTITQADQIFVLHEGHIVETGTHKELLTSSRRYASMWNLQVQT